MIKEEKKRENGVSRLDSMPINTIIGNDIVFKGDIYGESVIRIDGRVEGNISLKQGIILGDKAFVEGNMESDYIILFGHIRGNVKSKEIVLKSTGTISRIEEVEGGDYEPKPVEIVPLKQYEDE